MFGFLKDTLKKTVEKLTKEVDKATETVEPTEEEKKAIVEEIKEEKKKEEKKKEEKGFFTRLKEKIIGEEVSEEKEEKEEPEEEKKEAKTKEEKLKEHKKKQTEKKEHAKKEEKKKEQKKQKEEKYVDEAYGIEVIAEEKTQSVEEQRKEVEKVEEKKVEEAPKAHVADMRKREEEGEKEIDELLEKKKKEQEEEKQKEHEKKEEKGFFTRLKEKFTHKEEEQKKEAFEANEAEVKEFEEAFKEIETKPKTAEREEEQEEKIPVVTQTEEGETIFEMREKPTAVGKLKREHKEEVKKETTKEGIKHPKEEEKVAKKEAEKEEIKREQKQEETQEEGGFFGLLKNTIFKTSISEEKFEELFWELEVALLENNVAVEVIDLIKANLKKELVEKKILRGQINEIILKSLKESVEQTFDVEQVDLIEKIKGKKPYIVVFVGINGSGKTTTIAKMIQKLKDNNLSCVVAAGDTFRAAAIQQLEEHTTRLNVKLIKHDYGADPAAVGFDAIKYAQAHNIDCVLIDTAGRLHSNVNLMDEMKKIIRVTKPDFKIFIGEAITGNDCVDQARKFNEAVGIDGIILAKADVDEKGGAALSIGYVTKKPILYLGTGQKYSNLEEFDKEKIMEQLGLA